MSTKGYNPKRVIKPNQRTTNAKVLTVLNNRGAWVRVSYKSLDFYKKEYSVIEDKAINDHRIEYFNNAGKCVMVYEF